MEDTTAAPTAETSSASPAETSTATESLPPSFGDGTDDALTIALSAEYDKITATEKVEPEESVPDGTVVESDQPTNEGQETGEQGHATSSIEPPNSWSADAKAKWSAIPQDLQQVIADRERQAHEQITRQGETVKAFEPVTSYIQKHYPNVAPTQVIGNLLNAEAYLKSDPVGALKWLADSYKVDLAKQFGNSQEQTDQWDDGFRDPRFDQVTTELQSTRRELAEARQQIQQLGGFVQTHQQQQIQVKQQEIGSAIEAAVKELPYFNELEADIIAETEFLRSRNPDMPAKEVLRKAHQRALNNSDTYRAKAEQDRKAKEADEAAKKAAKSQQREATNVRGSTNGKQAPTRWDDDSFLSSAYDRITAS